MLRFFPLEEREKRKKFGVRPPEIFFLRDPRRCRALQQLNGAVGGGSQDVKRGALGTYLNYL